MELEARDDAVLPEGCELRVGLAFEAGDGGVEGGLGVAVAAAAEEDGEDGGGQVEGGGGRGEEGGEVELGCQVAVGELVGVGPEVLGVGGDGGGEGVLDGHEQLDADEVGEQAFGDDGRFADLADDRDDVGVSFGGGFAGGAGGEVLEGVLVGLV